jgi:hypothetical protein
MTHILHWPLNALRATRLAWQACPRSVGRGGPGPAFVTPLAPWLTDSAPLREGPADMSSKEGSGGFRKRNPHSQLPHSHRREEKDVNSSSPVMVAFKSFQLELDARRDKYERLPKLSRDLTWRVRGQSFCSIGLRVLLIWKKY